MSEHNAKFNFEDLIGRDPKFLACLRVARRTVSTDLPILITGESGTGKEMLAQAIHNASARASRPFVGINLAAMPSELVESELFGYEPGAFTGARERGSMGKFALAEDGTLLLDDVSEVPLRMQASLLRVLEERNFSPLASSKVVPFRARLVATSNRDLGEEVRKGNFRLDLYHRLRVVELRIPPLRERIQDIPLLVDHYARLHCARVGRDPVQVSPAVLKDLETFQWPGNIRELANLVAAKVTMLDETSQELVETPTVVLQWFRDTGMAQPPLEDGEFGEGQDSSAIIPLADLERTAIERAMKKFDGNVAEVAIALGVSKGTIYNKLKRYGLEEGRRRPPTGG